MRISIILVILAGVIFFSCPLALANDYQISPSRLHPASPFYFVKTIKENLELKFTGSNSDYNLKYFEFAQRRIKEISSLVRVNRVDLIPSTLEKYWSSLNKVSLSGDQMIRQVTAQINFLESVYHQIEDPAAKRSIRLTLFKIMQWNSKVLNSLTPEENIKFSAQINQNHNLICNLFSKEASSSGLNDTEKLVLLERFQKCLDTKSL